MKFYWCANTRAFRIAWLLEEAGVRYERVAIDIHDAAAKSDPAFRAVSPMGKVPALEDGSARRRLTQPPNDMDKKPAQRGDRRVPGLDVGCVRFLSHGVHVQGHLGGAAFEHAARIDRRAVDLGMRPVGALLFGRLADRFGRKPTLIWNILAYSILEMASGFAPNMSTLLIVRALFGIAMGGEWGVGSA